MNQKQMNEMNQILPGVRKKLIINLAINGVFPVILYVIVRPYLVSEFASLAIAGSVPAVRTILLWIWRRRVDWIGVIAVLGFSLALAVSAFSSGNSLLLKVHEQLLTGTVGLILLASVIIQKPLLLPVLQAVKGIDFKLSGNSESHKRINGVTATLGFMLLGNAAAHIVLALTLPTDAFLAVSRLITWAILGGGAAFLWWTRQGLGSQTD